MEAFTRLSSLAIPLMLDNIDTDMIIPKQFLTTVKRTGLGEGLFYDLRFNEDGTKIESFILNQEQWKNGKILVTGANFGCGSSREHAPWALLDFGIRCIIAESFADIFYNNCFKNGILPIQLPKGQVDALANIASHREIFTVDLNHKEIQAGDVLKLPFSIDSIHQECLLGGIDDIALTEKCKDKIESYEETQKQKYPWL